jgi:DNA repair protein RecO (recombination protein O)
LNAQVVHTELIVLSRLRYGDTSLIVRAYTRELGLQSYMVKGVLKPTKTGLKPSYFQSLTRLNAVVTYSAKSQKLEAIREAKPAAKSNGFSADVLKSNVALFMAEVLSMLLSEEQEDQQLYHFLTDQIDQLDTEAVGPDYLILFLLRLAHFMGCFPDKAFEPSQVFDLSQGLFTEPQQALTPLTPEASELLRRYLGTNFDNVQRINASKATRQEVLEGLLRYFSFQIAGFKFPKSLEIIQSIF